MLISEAKTQLDLARMIDERAKGVPLEQILGWAEFCGLRVAVEPGVFVPRYKTEFLAKQAIALCHSGSLVLELCCGSGAIGLAMISAIPSIHLLASDIDPVAVQCAANNLTLFGVEVRKGDLFDSISNHLKGDIEVLVANAPYVPTEAIEIMPREARLYESHASLDGGVDGLEVHRRIATGAAEWLAPGGHLLIEIGKTQATHAAKIFAENGLEPRITCSDEYDSTVVIGMKSR